jgi:hypothetical protein
MGVKVEIKDPWHVTPEQRELMRQRMLSRGMPMRHVMRLTDYQLYNRAGGRHYPSERDQRKAARPAWRRI